MPSSLNNKKHSCLGSKGPISYFQEVKLDFGKGWHFGKLSISQETRKECSWCFGIFLSITKRAISHFCSQGMNKQCTWKLDVSQSMGNGPIVKFVLEKRLNFTFQEECVGILKGFKIVPKSTHK